MKVMTARDAKNHFGEFLDAARREPVVITKNDRNIQMLVLQIQDHFSNDRLMEGQTR